MKAKEKPLGLEEAVARIKEQICRITDTEICPLGEADGRILAEDITAPIDQPPFPRSPYDGYAIRSADSMGAGPDSPVVLDVAGEVDAGEAADDSHPFKLPSEEIEHRGPRVDAPAGASSERCGHRSDEQGSTLLAAATRRVEPSAAGA